MLQGLGIAGMEERYLPRSGKSTGISPSSLEQHDNSNGKRCSVQLANLILVLVKDLKVYHSPVDLVHYAIHTCRKS